MKICLIGKHSNRTPFSYDVYKPFFMQFFTYVSNPEYADILVFGFVIDLEPNVEIIKKCQIKNPNVKIVVLSEEPLWDTLWGGDFFNQRQTRNIAGHSVDFLYLNHQNSNIFEFDRIPYFITTNDDYIARYQFMFSRNAKMSESEIKCIWDNASYDAAFFAEYREGEKYNVSFPEYHIYGLSDFRTRIAKDFDGNNILRVGQGWGTKKLRQDLPDWHLDKLVTLDKSCKYISALENTHQENYISEKIFDAYACLGIPIIFDQSKNMILRIVDDAFVLEVSKIREKDYFFTNLEMNISKYLKNQELLSKIMSIDNILKNRKNLVKKIAITLIS